MKKNGPDPFFFAGVEAEVVALAGLVAETGVDDGVTTPRVGTSGIVTVETERERAALFFEGRFAVAFFAAAFLVGRFALRLAAAFFTVRFATFFAEDFFAVARFATFFTGRFATDFFAAFLGFRFAATFLTPYSFLRRLTYFDSVFRLVFHLIFNSDFRLERTERVLFNGALNLRESYPDPWRKLAERPPTMTHLILLLRGELREREIKANWLEDGVVAEATLTPRRARDHTFKLPSFEDRFLRDEGGNCDESGSS